MARGQEFIRLLYSNSPKVNHQKCIRVRRMEQHNFAGDFSSTTHVHLFSSNAVKNQALWQWWRQIVIIKWKCPTHNYHAERSAYQVEQLHNLLLLLRSNEYNHIKWLFIETIWCGWNVESPERLIKLLICERVLVSEFRFKHRNAKKPRNRFEKPSVEWHWRHLNSFIILICEISTEFCLCFRMYLSSHYVCMTFQQNSRQKIQTEKASALQWYGR